MNTTLAIAAIIASVVKYDVRNITEDEAETNINETAPIFVESGDDVLYDDRITSTFHATSSPRAPPPLPIYFSAEVAMRDYDKVKWSLSGKT